MANDQIYFDRMPLTATRAHSIQNTHKKYCKISNSRLCTLNSYFCLKTGAVEVEERWQKDHLLLLSDKNYLCGKLFIALTNFLPQILLLCQPLQQWIHFLHATFFFRGNIQRYSGGKQACPSPRITWLTDARHGTRNSQAIILVWKHICWDFQVYNPLNLG